MFSSDRNIETIRELIEDLKAYVNLRTESFQIDFVSKLTILASRLILGLVLFVLATILFVILSVILIGAIAPLVGGTVAACAVMAALYLILAAIIYKKRTQWIVNPIANFLGHLFLDRENENDNKQETP